MSTEFLPKEFIERMEADLGSDLHAFLCSYEDEKVCALRINKLKERQETRAQVCGPIASTEQVPWCEDGYYYEDDNKPGHHPYHNAGVYYIQDASAQAPVELLGVEPGMKVLDLCAAPGGKSTQIAGKLMGEGLLVCNEPMGNRAKILSENIERMGVANAIVTSELPDKLSKAFVEYFDRILVDAPCSGEGMFRKNHDAAAEWSLDNVIMCANRQDGILDEAVKMLAQGGRLAYSTCTFAKAEDEECVQRLLSRHPEMKLISQKRLWPHEIKGEGHFEALFEKVESTEEGYTDDFSFKPASEKELNDFNSFCKATLNIKFDKSRLYLKGDLLYYMPEVCPDFAKIHVLRAGLFLGTNKKNRFEPSHALALWIKSEDVVNVANIASDDKKIEDYLNGQAIGTQAMDGWTLILVDNYSIGWGKTTKGLTKNHYPKGLRIQY